MCSLFSVDKGGALQGTFQVCWPFLGDGCHSRQCPSEYGLAAERHRSQGCESMGERAGKPCWLLWAGPGKDNCLCSLPPAARPAGACWVRTGEGSCCGSWGMNWEEDSVFLSLCQSNDPRDVFLGQVKRCRFVWELSIPQHCPEAAVPPHWCTVATPLPALLLSPFCLPVSLHWQHTAGPVVSSSFQPALLGQVGPERFCFCGCSLTCFPMWPWCTCETHHTRSH